MNFYIFSTVLMAISANCVTVPLGNPPPGAITDHSDAALSKPSTNTSDQGGHPIAGILPIDMSTTNSTTSNQTSDLNGTTTTQDRPAIFPMKPSNEGCVCPAIYLPVCSNTGKTFPSECDLKCEQKINPSLLKKADGSCSESHDHKRETDSKENPSILANSEDPEHKNSTLNSNCACPKYYNPICGSDGVTYSNDHCFACAQKVNSGLEKKNEGSCKTL